MEVAVTPQRLISWQVELFGTALAAGTTIALRSIAIAQAIAAGKWPESRESRRMVTEKAHAFSAGMVAATLELNRIWLRMALAGWRQQSALATAWLDAAQAAGKPAGIAARRNARRLKRRSS